MEYFEPDSRWELYQVTSAEEYVDKFVVKGKFHGAVPTDIKEAWQTVEYLLAHAYYYWPMYDEAFKKALLIIEMAVKIKAKAQNISLKRESNKKGKIFDRNLSDIIKEILEKEHYGELIKDFERARRIRNRQMHPENHSYMGGTISPNNFKLLVIVLNSLFQEEAWHKNHFDKNNCIKEQLKGFSNSLLVLENNQPDILIQNIVMHKVINNTLIIACNPIRNNIQELINRHASVKPYIIQLNDYKISDNEITGQSCSGIPIKIYKTEKDEYKAFQSVYIHNIGKCKPYEIEIHLNGLYHETSWEMVKEEYNLL